MTWGILLLLGILFGAFCALWGFHSNRQIADLKIKLERAQATSSDAEEWRRRAFTDTLTGLASRALFLDHLELAIAAAEREKHSVAVLFLDLNGFKAINDRLGHHHGDETLIRVARRIMQTVRDADTICRWGGDEFAILLNGNSSTSEARVVAEKLAKALQITCGDSREILYVSAAIGIALFPNHALSLEALIDHADTKMYVAKRSVYTADVTQRDLLNIPPKQPSPRIAVA